VCGKEDVQKKGFQPQHLCEQLLSHKSCDPKPYHTQNTRTGANPAKLRRVWGVGRKRRRRRAKETRKEKRSVRRQTMVRGRAGHKKGCNEGRGSKSSSQQQQK
jgi:hypothetical protein